MIKSRKEAEQYFFILHDKKVNQKYGDEEFNIPYSFHLNNVVNFAEKFRHLVPSEKFIFVIVGCLGHDSIEDGRLSFNNIKDQFGEEVAEIIFLCTENKGRSRSERKDDKFYQELAQNDLALFVKLCDIMANSTFSLATNSSMFEKYKKEFDKVVKLTWTARYQEMYDFLEKLYKINE
jgi:(p)ppGpp synthase/HD superfamily hydrolase